MHTVGLCEAQHLTLTATIILDLEMGDKCRHEHERYHLWFETFFFSVFVLFQWRMAKPLVCERACLWHTQGTIKVRKLKREEKRQTEKVSNVEEIFQCNYVK